MSSTVSARVKEGEAKKAEEKALNRTATFAELFSCAEPIDVLYMVLGTFGGLITGVSLPVFNVLFGQMLDALNSGPDSFTDVSTVVIV
jgi:hypothetical protein